jgi:EAL domain-containing protein (putative c-di-GMP-specific phosphodiesterase class I)
LVTQVNSPELLRIVQGIGINYAQGDAVARVTPILFQTTA